jgi:acyl-CoA thioester hydrolase
MTPPDASMPAEIAAPFLTEGLRVLPDWIDVNGHMNVARYVQVFDMAVDRLYEAMGMSFDSMIRGGGSTFTVEMHITYQHELRLDEPLRVETQLVGHDDKRQHFFQRLYQAEAGYLAATGEWLLLYIDMQTRRAAAMPPWLLERVARLRQAHASLPAPAELGRGVRLGGRRTGSGN